VSIQEDTEGRILWMGVHDMLKVLTDEMFWSEEAVGFTCTEAEAIAGAAVALGADVSVMADLVVRYHGREDDEGDLHYQPKDPDDEFDLTCRCDNGCMVECVCSCHDEREEEDEDPERDPPEA
jgi:hypothetical protein